MYRADTSARYCPDGRHANGGCTRGRVGAGRTPRVDAPAALSPAEAATRLRLTDGDRAVGDRLLAHPASDLGRPLRGPDDDHRRLRCASVLAASGEVPWRADR